MADEWRETMNSRRKEGKFCDFKIVVGNTTFPVHRIVLDTFSKYFNVMFSNDMRESREGYFELVGFTPSAGKAVIDFLYTGQLELSLDSTEEVLKLCHMWQLHAAVDKCKEFLLGNIGISNCINFWKLAQIYDLEALKHGSCEFVLHNLQELDGQENIAGLVRGDILTLLDGAHESDVSLVTLWQFMVNWGLHGNEMCDVIEAFPLSRLSFEDLKQVIWPDQHVQLCKKCKQFVGYEMLDLAVENGKWQDAIFLREVSREFPNERILDLTEKLILEHHFEVFQSTDFLSLGKKDILHFIGKIDCECTVEELSAIIAWLAHHADRRHVFPILFDYKGKRNRWTSTFKKSISSSSKLFNPNYSGRCAKPPWRYIYFLKSLAAEYNCSTFEDKVDRHIVKYFSVFCKLDGFKGLDLSDVMKYVSSSQVEFDEKVLWYAVLEWIQVDLTARGSSLTDLLKSLPVGRFSVKFIRSEILNCSVVASSKKNLTILMSIFLDKLASIEEKVGIRQPAAHLGKQQKFMPEMHLGRIERDIEGIRNENRYLQELVTKLQKELKEVKKECLGEVKKECLASASASAIKTNYYQVESGTARPSHPWSFRFFEGPPSTSKSPES